MGSCFSHGSNRSRQSPCQILMNQKFLCTVRMSIGFLTFIRFHLCIVSIYVNFTVGEHPHNCHDRQFVISCLPAPGTCGAGWGVTQDLVCSSLWLLPVCPENGAWALWTGCAGAMTLTHHSPLVLGGPWKDGENILVGRGHGIVWHGGAEAWVPGGDIQEALRTSAHIWWREIGLAGRNSPFPSLYHEDRISHPRSTLCGCWDWTGSWSFGRIQGLSRVLVSECC